MTEMLPPKTKTPEAQFTYYHPAVGAYSISRYVVDTLEGGNMRDGASRQDSGWYLKESAA